MNRTFFVEELVGKVICPCINISGANDAAVIVSSPLGNTTMVRAANLSACLAFAQIHLSNNNTCVSSCPLAQRLSPVFSVLPPVQCVYEDQLHGNITVNLFESKCQYCSDPYCEQCPASISRCQKCLTGRVLYNASCVDSCPAGTFNNMGSCQACAQSSCNTCAPSDPTGCLVCRYGLFLDPQSGAQCVDGCAQSPVRTNGTLGAAGRVGAECERCQILGCINCKNGAATCTRCSPNLYLSGNTCVATCPAGATPQDTMCMSSSSSSFRPAMVAIPVCLVAFFVVVIVVYRMRSRSAFRQRETHLRQRLMSTEEEVDALKRVWEIDPSELQMNTDVLGAGSYGTVYRGSYHGIAVAIKKLHEDKGADAPRKEQEFEHEIAFLRTIRHPNIVLFFGCGRFGDGARFLVTELLVNGSLRTVLSDSKQSITWPQRLQFALDAARGMAHIHSLNKMHRDLKSGNLLVSTNFEVKVADFGTSTILGTRATTEQLEASGNLMMTRFVGTPLWMAPEVLFGQTYSFSADVFSFGIVMWEIATRRWPWDEDPSIDSADRLRQAVLSGRRPTVTHECPPAYVRLMQRCWSGNAGERPAFTRVLEDDGLKESSLRGSVSRA